MKKTKEKTKEKEITDITNLPEFRSLANDLTHCDQKEHSNKGSVIPVSPIHPELEALIDNFLFLHLKNTFLDNIQANISIMHPKPQYPEINHDSDNYDANSEEDRIQTWLSKVELPSEVETMHFTNMDDSKLKNKVYSSDSKSKKKPKK